VIFLANALVNKPLDNPVYLLMNVWWMPVSQFWYLQTLAFCHLLMVIALRTGRMSFALFLSVAGLFLSTYYNLASPIRILAHFFPYYLIGAYLGASGFRKALALARSPTVSFPLLAAALAVSLITTWVLAHTDWSAFSAEPNQLHASDIAKLGWAANPITQLLAISALLTLCLHLPKGTSKIAEMIGANSFPIYILHVFCVAGVRIALDKGLHVSSIALIITASVAAGLICPVVLSKWLEARHLDRMLGLGV
jgi:fucose 4-O-acetylase-like acetyltransferase